MKTRYPKLDENELAWLRRALEKEDPGTLGKKLGEYCSHVYSAHTVYRAAAGGRLSSRTVSDIRRYMASLPVEL